jgi:hypothetical protein
MPRYIGLDLPIKANLSALNERFSATKQRSGQPNFVACPVDIAVDCLILPSTILGCPCISWVKAKDVNPKP